MPVVPHTYNYFGAFALLLRPESIGSLTIDGGWEMDVGEASGYLNALIHFNAEEKGVKRAAFPKPMVLQILGGDPFLRFHDLEHLLNVVPPNQFLVEVCTAGLWLKDSRDIGETLDRLQAKVYVLVLDTSRALLDHIGIQRVEELITEARKRRIGLYIRCGVSAEAPFPLDLLALEVMNSDTSIIQAVPMTESLNSATPLLSETPPLRRRCAESFVFLVTPGGDIYPCARGAGLSALRLGSLKTESISEILDRVRPDKPLRHLRQNGPFALYQAMQQSEHADRLWPGYLDACQFHRQALSDPELSLMAQQEEIYVNPSPTTRRMPLPVLKG